MDQKVLDGLLQDIVDKIGFITDTDVPQGNFNIFCVLGIDSREVIICRLLRELLDPAGSHNAGHGGLYRFVRDTLGYADFSENDALHSKIVTEERINKNRRVDIVIHTPKGVIPIEVKIWAEDQGAQLSDYYRYYQKQDKKLLTGKIYYLTPTGWKPSEKSRGKLRVTHEISLLSFGEDIRMWLTSYLCNTSDSMVQLCIKQFLEVIEIMSKNVNEMNALIESICVENMWDIEKASAALLLLKHGQQIHEEILKSYLKKNVKFGEGITVSDCVDADRSVDSHALVRLVQNGKPIACVCVDTNLYLFCKKKNNEEKCEGWVDYENGQYRWIYISPKGYMKEKYPLKNIVELKPIEVALKDILKDITTGL